MKDYTFYMDEIIGKTRDTLTVEVTDGNLTKYEALRCNNDLIKMNIQCEHMKQLTRIADGIEKMNKLTEAKWKIQQK